MKKKVYIGAEVNSARNGKGVIEKIITPSTGYVEVRYESGLLKKEMAFNLKDSEGNPLKATPKKAAPKPVTMATRLHNGIETLLKVNDAWNNQAINENMASCLNRKHGNEAFEGLVNAWFDVYVGKRGARFTRAQAEQLAKALLGI